VNGDQGYDDAGARGEPRCRWGSDLHPRVAVMDVTQPPDVPEDEHRRQEGRPPRRAEAGLGSGGLFLTRYGTRYGAQNGQAVVAFAANLPGRILPIEIGAQGGIFGGDGFLERPW